MLSAAPITPEQRSGAHREGMQQHTDLTRLCRLCAVPLTLLAQGTGTTIADPGRVEHPQAAIGFAALLGWVQRLAAGQRKVPSGWRGKSSPEKRPAFQDVAAEGLP